MEFIKKHPCITVSAFGVLINILTVLNEELALKGARLVGIAIFGFVELLCSFGFVAILLVALLFTFNLAAMSAVINDKLDAGIIFALPFGGFGAIIGLLQNPNYFNKNAVKIIFSVQLWFIIWLAVSLIMWSLRYF